MVSRKVKNGKSSERWPSCRFKPEIFPRLNRLSPRGKRVKEDEVEDKGMKPGRKGECGGSYRRYLDNVSLGLN